MSVDLGAESRLPRMPWQDALAKAIGFEYACALTAQSPDPGAEHLVRTQHVRNANLLEGLIFPGRN